MCIVTQATLSNCYLNSSSRIIKVVVSIALLKIEEEKKDFIQKMLETWRMVVMMLLNDVLRLSLEMKI